MDHIDGTEPARIVIAEDSAVVRLQLERVLGQAPLRAEVRAVGNGAAALKEALTWPHLDCVLSDVEMPLMSGLQLLRSIRSQKNRLELPVLLLTANTDVDLKVQAFELGASDFVAKPFEPAEVLARVQAHVHLARMHRQLTQLANTDTLTGLSNRRRFHEIFAAETSRAQRLERDIALILLDVDHFKRINDQKGHPEGDAVLTSIGSLLRKSHRIYDHLGRVGGEEFAVLLPEVSLEGACIVAERVRQRIVESGLGNLPVGSVTASLGIVHRPGGTKPTTDELYRRADAQLYRAKEAGRNRWCVEDQDA